ncbi:GspH/FimT family pseudopilin [Moraxella marmotae]|uniref:GspH/FimT family pseudopilin n=1 Tax=Moraxella marmotae TaxID=3344520 RepID=UPI0035F3C13E
MAATKVALSQHGRTAQLGFSLIELMVVLAILAVLTVIAMPAYESMMRHYESHVVSRHLQESIRRAKIEAVLHQQDVIICPVNHNGRCDRYGQSGLMVFVDKNRNNQQDDTDIVVMQQPLALKYGTLSMRVSLARHYIKFMGDSAKPRGHIGSIYYCSERAALSHQTVINMYGLVSVKQGNVKQLDCQ